MNASASKKFPAALRWGLIVWLAVWLPVYWHTWGAINFLHFCDIAVILTCIGFISNSALLISSQAVAAILIDATWTVDIVCKILFGRYLLGGAEYMFDGHYALWVRLLSLFHIAVPILLLWGVWRYGYDRRGWLLQLGIAFAAFVASRFTNPALNMNYAFADPFFHRQWGPAPTHILVIFMFMLVVVYLPTHLVLKRWAKKPELA
ncbi:MAG TPA: hypothetical protein VJS43_17535 [Candidatus Acidoferrales bacterium]|nr:hypothetical protein [Candidatus Acidoferrales bacterium]